MKNIFFASAVILLIAAVILAGDYFYRQEKSFLAYILANGDYLLNLVNKENTLGKYAPADLVELNQLGAPKKHIRAVVYDDLAQMLADAKKDGTELKILSAWRSYDYQKSVFAWFAKRFKNAATFSAEAGHSEHQLGTTVDFGSGAKTDLTASFAKTAQGKWLAANAQKYGFIMSYPEGKEAVTGYIFEPWHYRFVGVETAQECYRQGLSSRECLSQKPQQYKNNSLQSKLD